MHTRHSCKQFLMDIPNGNGVISSRYITGDQADQRFVWLASGKPWWSPGGAPRNRYRRPFYALLPHYRPLYASSSSASRQQVALVTNDFHVTFGLLMVEMTARLFLKRHGHPIHDTARHRRRYSTLTDRFHGDSGSNCTASIAAGTLPARPELHMGRTHEKSRNWTSSNALAAGDV